MAALSLARTFPCTRQSVAFVPEDAGSVLIFSFVILEGNSRVNTEDKNIGIMAVVCTRMYVYGGVAVLICFFFIIIKYLLKAQSFSSVPGYVLYDSH